MPVAEYILKCVQTSGSYVSFRFAKGLKGTRILLLFHSGEQTPKPLTFFGGRFMIAWANCSSSTSNATLAIFFNLHFHYTMEECGKLGPAVHLRASDDKSPITDPPSRITDHGLRDLRTASTSRRAFSVRTS